MPPDLITSRQNSLIKKARAVRDGKASGEIFIEGVRLCEEALRTPALEIEEILYTDKLLRDERGRDLLGALGRRSPRAAVVAEPVFSSISDTKTPQGILVLAQRPRADLGSFEQKMRAAAADTDRHPPLIVVLHRINNPQNAGAMLRVAEAAGATGVITTRESADIFSPKALRGAMGSSFRVPVWSGGDFGGALAWCARHQISTLSTDVRAAKAHTDVDWTLSCAVVFGAEAEGLADTETAATTMSIRIPMRAPVESLNVAVALAVVLYEAARQRSARR